MRRIVNFLLVCFLLSLLPLERAMALSEGVIDQAEQPVQELEDAEEEEEEEEGEEAKEWSLWLNLDYFSKYVWRGLNIVDGPVFQPFLTFGYKGFSLGIWGNQDWTNVNGDAGEFSEVNLSVEYSREWEDFFIDVGVLNYRYPTSEADPNDPNSEKEKATTEVYGALGLNVPLYPTVTLYRDVDEVDGTYVSLSVEQDIEEILDRSPTVSLSIDFKAALGWGSEGHNDFYYGVDDSAFTDALFSLGFPVEIGDHVTLTPSVSYTILLDQEIRKKNRDDDSLVAGVSLSLGF